MLVDIMTFTSSSCASSPKLGLMIGTPHVGDAQPTISRVLKGERCPHEYFQINSIIEPFPSVLTES